jgi:hypothetical protein
MRSPALHRSGSSYHSVAQVASLPANPDSSPPIEEGNLMVNRLFRGVVHRLVKGDQPAANVALVSTSNESCDHHSSMGSSVTEQRGSTVLSSSGFLPTSLFPQIFKKRKLRKLKVLGFMPIMALLLTPAVVFAGVLA